MKYLSTYKIFESSNEPITIEKLRNIIDLYKECFIDIVDAGAIIKIQPNREGVHHVGLWDEIDGIDDNALNAIIKIVKKYGLKTLHFHIKDMYQSPDNLIEDPYNKVNPAKDQQRLRELYTEVVNNLQAGEDKFNSISTSNKLTNVSTRIEIITKEEYTEDDSDKKRIDSLMKDPGMTSLSHTGTPLGHARLTGYSTGVRKRRGIIKKIKDFFRGGYRYQFTKLHETDKVRSIDIVHEINI